MDGKLIGECSLCRVFVYIYIYHNLFCFHIVWLFHSLYARKNWWSSRTIIIFSSLFESRSRFVLVFWLFLFVRENKQTQWYAEVRISNSFSASFHFGPQHFCWMNSATSFDDDNNPFSVKIIVSSLNEQISIQNGWKKAEKFC